MAETPAEIFEEMDARKRASLKGIDDFSVMKTRAGMCSLEHYVKESTTAADGRGKVEYMRLLSQSEVATRRSPDSPMAQASADDLERMAGEIEREGAKADTAMRTEMQSAGLPPALGTMIMNPPKDEPWLSPMPGDMGSNYAMMLRAGATGKREDANRAAQAETEAQRDPYADIARRTRVIGHDKVNGRPAIELLADNLDYKQGDSGEDFTLNTMHLWVDAEHYVPLKMQMDGVAMDRGEKREVRIEREDMEYSKEPGCEALFEPQRSVMRIAGILSPEEQAKMVEAQAKLAEFKTQLAGMPQSQQDMITRQMGPQMEMMEGMASGKGMEIVSVVTGMRCNAGMPSNEEYMQTVPGLSAGSCNGFSGSHSGLLLDSTPDSAPSSQPAVQPAGQPTLTAAEVQTAQQACLEKKIAKAEKAQKKKRGFGSLMSAVSRTAGRLGNNEVSQTMGDVYDANATSEDLASAAKDLGLTEDDVEACRNPG